MPPKVFRFRLLRVDATGRTRRGDGRLTPREIVVLELLLKGKPNKLSATLLGIQESTVKVHRSRLMRKLEVRSLVVKFVLHTN